MQSTNSWQNVSLIALLYLLVTAVFACYVPVIYRTQLYDLLSLGIIGITALLTLMTVFRSHFLSNRFILVFSILLFFLIIEFVVFHVGHLRYNLDDVRQIVIVFLCVVIGYTLQMTEKQLTAMILFYSIGAILIGIVAIVSYTGDFSFGGDRTLIAGKNQIGGMVAVGAALALYHYLVSEKRRVLFLILAILAFVVSAVLRCRSAFVAFIFFLFVIGAKELQTYKIILMAVIMLLVYLIFKTAIDNFFIDTLVGDSGLDVDDLSTGRSERNVMGLEYLKGHLFVGELLEDAGIPWIHNYLLLRTVRYGVWVLFFVSIYFVFLGKMVKEYFGYKYLPLEKIGFFIPIVPFFISLLEPSYPFGPGTVQIFVYVLFGFSLHGHEWDEENEWIEEDEGIEGNENES